MPSTPPDRKTVILRHAADLFAHRGITGTTVREIADAVGMLSGSLYHHFKSKDEMVSAIVMGYLDDLQTRYDEVASSDQGPLDRLTALVRVSLAVIEAHPHATEIYQNSGAYLPRLAEYEHMKIAADTVQRTWIQLIDEGVAAGAFRADIPTRFLYRLLRDSLWLSVRWFRPTVEYSMAQFGDDLVSIFTDGIKHA